MRPCPYCSEKTISVHKLVFQDIGVPMVVALCSSCQAVVSLKSRDNLFMAIPLEFAVTGLALLLFVWSFNIFQVIWPAVLFGVWIYIARLYVKALGPLDYVR